MHVSESPAASDFARQKVKMRTAVFDGRMPEQRGYMKPMARGIDVGGCVHRQLLDPALICWISFLYLCKSLYEVLEAVRTVPIYSGWRQLLGDVNDRSWSLHWLGQRKR